MNILSKIALSLTFLFATHSASAGFLLEPYLGFGSGNVEITGTEGDLSTTNFGTKLGYQAPIGLQVGADLQLGAGSYEFTADSDFASVDFGLFLGYQTMIGLRFYATYMLASAVGVDTTVDYTLSGTGFKLGVGWKILRFVALNLEYQGYTYDTLDLDGLGSNDIENSSTDYFMLNVSFPFNIGG